MRTHKINNLYFEYGHLLPRDAHAGIKIAHALKAVGLIEIVETDSRGGWVRYAELPRLYKCSDKQGLVKQVLLDRVDAKEVGKV